MDTVSLWKKRTQIWRGTTPCLFFKLPGVAYPGEIQRAQVWFRQQGKTLLKRQCPVSAEGVLTVPLTKEETLDFCRGTVYVQVKLDFYCGARAVSNWLQITVFDVL